MNDSWLLIGSACVVGAGTAGCCAVGEDLLRGCFGADREARDRAVVLKKHLPHFAVDVTSVCRAFHVLDVSGHVAAILFRSAYLQRKVRHRHL